MYESAAINTLDHEGEPAPTMRMHLWFETDEGVIFGLGRLMLLREVEACGSLKAAAQKLGMSYRGAWGKIKKTEEALGLALVEKGVCRRAGYQLTEYGQELARQFDLWFREVEEFALSKSGNYLPFSLIKYA